MEATKLVDLFQNDPVGFEAALVCALNADVWPYETSVGICDSRLVAAFEAVEGRSLSDPNESIRRYEVHRVESISQIKPEDIRGNRDSGHVKVVYKSPFLICVNKLITKLNQHCQLYRISDIAELNRETHGEISPGGLFRMPSDTDADYMASGSCFPGHIGNIRSYIEKINRVANPTNTEITVSLYTNYLKVEKCLLSEFRIILHLLIRLRGVVYNEPSNVVQDRIDEVQTAYERIECAIGRAHSNIDAYTWKTIRFPWLKKIYGVGEPHSSLINRWLKCADKIEFENVLKNTDESNYVTYANHLADEILHFSGEGNRLGSTPSDEKEVTEQENNTRGKMSSVMAKLEEQKKIREARLRALEKKE